MYISAHDALTGGLFAHLLGQTSDESRSLATIVRTNAVAVHVFHSLLDIDPMDALEDYLDRQQAGYTDVTCFMALLEETSCDSAGRSSVFQVTGYSPLKYVINFSPEKVKFCLADGEDAAEKPCLV